MTRYQILRSCAITCTDGFPTNTVEDIKRWVIQHGGSFVMCNDEGVTHMIVSPKACKDKLKTELAMVAARRRRTCFLVRLSWLKDSLYQKRICDETGLDILGKSYSIEPSHARKVRCQLTRQAKERRKQKRRCQEQGLDQAHGGGECTLDVGEPVEATHISSDGHGVRPLPQRFETRFDLKTNKTILAFEHDMACKGYRPFIDDSGFLYHISLLRTSSHPTIVEQYNLIMYKYDTDETTTATARVNDISQQTPLQISPPSHTSLLPPRTTFLINDAQFAVHVQLIRSRKSVVDTVVQAIIESAGTFKVSLAKFCAFYKKKTGTEIALDGLYASASPTQLAQSTEFFAQNCHGIDKFTHLVNKTLIEETKKRYAHVFGGSWLSDGIAESGTARGSESRLEPA